VPLAGGDRSDGRHAGDHDVDRIAAPACPHCRQRSSPGSSRPQRPASPRRDDTPTLSVTASNQPDNLTSTEWGTPLSTLGDLRRAPSLAAGLREAAALRRSRADQAPSGSDRNPPGRPASCPVTDLSLLRASPRA
jgi:hypothetical protein